MGGAGVALEPPRRQDVPPAGRWQLGAALQAGQRARRGIAAAAAPLRRRNSTWHAPGETSLLSPPDGAGSVEGAGRRTHRRAHFDSVELWEACLRFLCTEIGKRSTRCGPFMRSRVELMPWYTRRTRPHLSWDACFVFCPLYTHHARVAGAGEAGLRQAHAHHTPHIWFTTLSNCSGWLLVEVAAALGAAGGLGARGWEERCCLASSL